MKNRTDHFNLMLVYYLILLFSMLQMSRTPTGLIQLLRTLHRARLPPQAPPRASGRGDRKHRSQCLRRWGQVAFGGRWWWASISLNVIDVWYFVSNYIKLHIIIRYTYSSDHIIDSIFDRDHASINVKTMMRTGGEGWALQVAIGAEPWVDDLFGGDSTVDIPWYTLW